MNLYTITLSTNGNGYTMVFILHKVATYNVILFLETMICEWLYCDHFCEEPLWYIDDRQQVPFLCFEYYVFVSLLL